MVESQIHRSIASARSALGIKDDSARDPAESLAQYFSSLPAEEQVVIAFSGGVDSSVVAALATNLLRSERVTALFFDTPLVLDEDRENAKRIADEMHLSLEVIDFDPLIIDAVRHNRADRCYYCKNALFSLMQEYYPNAFLCDGTNADDDPARRPGMRALAELGIHSPLRACSISKDEVRQIARALGLSNADRVSGSCRATALPYDIDIATVFRAD